MKPKPLASLNHFTFPDVLIEISFLCCLRRSTEFILDAANHWCTKPNVIRAPRIPSEVEDRQSCLSACLPWPTRLSVLQHLTCENPHMRTSAFAFLLLGFAFAALAQQQQQQQPEFVRRAQDLVRSGKLEEALAVYDAELKTSPN